MGAADISVFIRRAGESVVANRVKNTRYGIFIFFSLLPPESSAIPRAAFLRTRVIAIVTMRGRGREYASDVRPNDFGK